MHTIVRVEVSAPEELLGLKTKENRNSINKNKAIPVKGLLKCEICISLFPSLCRFPSAYSFFHLSLCLLNDN